MAQVFVSNNEETTVRSDLQVPADADGPQIQRTIIVVNSFLEDGQRVDTIEFVLDERFRERVDAALKELIERGEGIIADPGTLERDFSQTIRVELGPDLKTYASVTMKHDLFREEIVDDVVDSEFKEFV